MRVSEEELAHTHNRGDSHLVSAFRLGDLAARLLLDLWKMRGMGKRS